ncbi:helix-turn-helix domain-containing protein [[Mycobacterium] burgundiense]|uniref:Helix-turn-helix domain-containing protein n=1 Tax=[Mycobacterium] burgundiense TaxID=3064286 RepID=A0ABM9LV65_9MYCO|nr:helix-turn-helix domain-containing protein [Mycolicibacterium sp. MU0053]CAJ1505249.1 helix-turn-helix domain-containing protein [Mycolicibacterium sp. MU0053]
MTTATTTFTPPTVDGVPASVVTVPVAAALLNAGQRSVWRWIADGQLPALRLPSGSVRIRVSDLEGLVAPLARD